MADSVKPEGQQENGEQQGVVSRVGSLPLVSSAVEAVSSAYASTKDSVPLLKGVMDAAESGVRTLGAAATTGSKPILDRLEPQIATVSEYAMMGLDKMEQNLPILQQPADKLVSDTMGRMYESVTGARDAVTGARDAVTGAVFGAVMGGVEMTRAAVSGGLSTVLGSRVGQMVTSGVGLALTRSEDWVEQHLPLSERELAAVAEPAPGVEVVALAPGSGGPSYFVRLGKLSSKVQERALEQSLARARRARDASLASVTQIASALDLLESARATLGDRLGDAQEQLLQRWRDWQEGQPRGAGGEGEGEAGPKDQKEQLEWRTLSLVRGLSGQLRSACGGVVSSAQGLPAAVQDQLASARRAADDLQASLGSTSAPLTPVLLDQSRRQLTMVRQSLDGVMDYLLNNTPLNWLVGPFAPQLSEKGLPPPSSH